MTNDTIAIATNEPAEVGRDAGGWPPVLEVAVDGIANELVEAQEYGAQEEEDGAHLVVHLEVQVVDVDVLDAEVLAQVRHETGHVADGGGDEEDGDEEDGDEEDGEVRPTREREKEGLTDERPEE